MKSEITLAEIETLINKLKDLEKKIETHESQTQTQTETEAEGDWASNLSEDQLYDGWGIAIHRSQAREDQKGNKKWSVWRYYSEESQLTHRRDTFAKFEESCATYPEAKKIAREMARAIGEIS